MSYYLDKSVEECKLKNDSWIYCKETVDGKNCDTCEDDGYFDDEGKCIGVKYCSQEAPFVKCKKCNDILATPTGGKLELKEGVRIKRKAE